MDDLAQISVELAGAPASRFQELLAKRRASLELAAARPTPEQLAVALQSGRDARSRLLVEMGALRSKIEDLRRLRLGLKQLRPAQAAPPSLDVRL